MSWPINTPGKHKEWEICGSVHPGDAYRIQQHKSSTITDSRRVGQAAVRLASSGKSNSFLCSPFCAVDEKNASLEVVESSCVRSPSRSLFTSVVWVQPQVRDAIDHHREDQPSCKQDCLQQFCLSELVGGWGLLLIPLKFMCPELVARCLRVTW